MIEPKQTKLSEVFWDRYIFGKSLLGIKFKDLNFLWEGMPKIGFPSPTISYLAALFGARLWIFTAHVPSHLGVSKSEPQTLHWAQKCTDNQCKWIKICYWEWKNVVHQDDPFWQDHTLPLEDKEKGTLYLEQLNRGKFRSSHLHEEVLFLKGTLLHNY